MNEREQVAGDGEPLFTKSRGVRDIGPDNDLYQNIPYEAVSVLDLDPCDELEIEIYQDGYVVMKK